MKAVYYRFLNEDGNFTDYVGMAIAKDMVDLFWIIDEFGNPHSCVIKDIQGGGICFNVKSLGLDESEETEELQEESCDLEFELSGAFASQLTSNKWQTPKWPSPEKIYGAFIA